MTHRLSYFLISLLIAFAPRGVHAQAPALTQISDVVYRADGSPAHGTLTIAWDAFTTADGHAVPANKITVALGANGALSVQLAPNAGATPAGSFYKVVLNLGGDTSTEYWVVPTSSPTTVAAIRSSVMPATVAAQFASVAYVDSAVSNAQAGNIKTLSGIRFADKFSNIQAAITDAGTSGAVLIPSSYAANDTYTNPDGIPILDLRSLRMEVTDLALRDGMWRDVRSYGADCTGQQDSRAALQAAIQSNKKIISPPGCKLKIFGQSLAITASGWEFDGSGNWHNDPSATTIFGCGAGTGAVIDVNRSGDWKFHGARVVARGDTSLCGSGNASTFTKSLEWDNTGSSGQTSTKAEIYDVALSPGALLGAAGSFYPVIQSGKDCGGNTGTSCAPAPSNGNQVGYISVAAGGVASGIHQETGATIANGTAYSLTLDITFPTWPAFITFTPSTARVDLTANGISVASITPTMTQGVWTHATLSYTGTSSTAGQALGVSITNTTSPASGISEIWFDNLGATNFTLQNASFESPAMNPGNSIFPLPQNWQSTGGFQYVGLQIGAGSPTSFAAANLESGSFHDSSITGSDLPGSIGILATGCCDQSWKLSNLAITSLKWGVAGTLGYEADNINASGVGAYSRQGLGGGLIATAGCANGVITLDHVSTTDASGPFLTSMFSGAGNSAIPCSDVVMIGNQLGVPDIAPSAYAIDAAAFNQLSIYGGYFSSTAPFAAWIGSSYANAAASVVASGYRIDPNSVVTATTFIGPHVTTFTAAKDGQLNMGGSLAGNNPAVAGFGVFLTNGFQRRLWGVNESHGDGSPLNLLNACAEDSSICAGESGEIEIQSVPPEYPVCSVVGGNNSGGQQIFALVPLDASSNKSMARYNFCQTPATYDASHYPALSWLASPGASSYDVLWCSDPSHCYKVTNTSATNFNITVQPTTALPAYTLASYNQTAVIKLRGQLQMAAGSLPAPTTTTLGAINSKDCGPEGSGQFVQKINTDGSITCAASSGSGTVTSVALSLPTVFNVSGSPVTSSGTLTASLANQSANQVFAGPTSGVAAPPTFRALVKADLPALACADLSNAAASCSTDATNAANITTGTLPIARLSGLGTAKQILTAGSPPSFIDFPDVKVIPAASCNNATAGSAWDLPASNAPSVACRTGTNNLGGVLQWANNNSTTNAQFSIELPADWDTAAQPYIAIYYGSGANASGTVKWTFSTACSKNDGSISDDAAFNAESATAGKTMAAANRMWSESLQFTAVTSANNCTPGANMIVKITSGNGTATSSVNVTKVVMTFPRLLTLQAN